MKILICGFSGAGKTTFLQMCKDNSLGFQCLDLDQELSLDLKIQSNQLGQWIRLNGLPLFRELEAAKIKELLSHPQKAIIALGGGALSQSLLANCQLSRENKVVFLDTPFEECFERIQNDPNRIFSSMSKDQLFELYQDRLPYYLQADLKITHNSVKAIQGLGILESLVHNLLNPKS